MIDAETPTSDDVDMLLLLRSDDRQATYRLVNQIRAYEGVRLVRGDLMRTWDGLYAEMSSALQFFLGWGWNFDALYECLRDAELRYPENARLCLVVAAEEVLADESDGELEKFVECLIDASADAEDVPRERSTLRARALYTVVMPFDMSEFPLSKWSQIPSAIRELDVSDRSATLSFIEKRLNT